MRIRDNTICKGFSFGPMYFSASHYVASRALPSIFTTWQAMHTCMIPVPGKQGLHIQVLLPGKQGAKRYLQICEQCPNGCSVLGEQCSDPDLPAKNRTGSLGTPPKPRDHTSCELRVFSNRFLYVFKNTLRQANQSTKNTKQYFYLSAVFSNDSKDHFLKNDRRTIRISIRTNN